MTNYYLQLGYQASAPYIETPNNSLENPNAYDDFLWGKLKELFYEVAKNNDRMKSDILAIGFKKFDCHQDAENESDLDECLSYLSKSVENGPEAYPGINSEDRDISFSTNCQTKYQVYRSLIRLVMYEAHKIGLELSIEVR